MFSYNQCYWVYLKENAMVKCTQIKPRSITSDCNCNFLYLSHSFMMITQSTLDSLGEH